MKTKHTCFFNFITSRSGMTLVEIVVAFAIIALAALTLVAAIGTAGNITRRGADIESASNAAYADAENADQVINDGTVTFNAHGQTYTINGKYIEGKQQVDDVEQEYVYFDPSK